MSKLLLHIPNRDNSFYTVTTTSKRLKLFKEDFAKLENFFINGVCYKRFNDFLKVLKVIKLSDKEFFFVKEHFFSSIVPLNELISRKPNFKKNISELENECFISDIFSLELIKKILDNYNPLSEEEMEAIISTPVSYKYAMSLFSDNALSSDDIFFNIVRKFISSEILIKKVEDKEFIDIVKEKSKDIHKKEVGVKISLKKENHMNTKYTE